MKRRNTGNIYSKLPVSEDKEIFKAIFADKRVRIERIVSKGQKTPEGKWLKDNIDEWVIVLKGCGKIKFKGNQPVITLKKGDYILIPRNTCHRVEWTSLRQETIWLAVHIKP